MKVDLFDFDLPRALIAERPAEPREAARLLHVAARTLTDRRVGDLPRLLAPGDLLVVNDTKVIPARLRGRRGTAGLEIMLHQQLSSRRWRAFARPARKLRPGDVVRFAEEFTATVEAREEGGQVVLEFSAAGPALMELLERHGEMPLPPYIKRAADARDSSDYQTLFARAEGAVAAPTAGLHFTPALLQALAEQGVGLARLTLHVGAGTFLPVKAEDTADHRMHAEWGEITAGTAAAIMQTRAAGGRVIAVGTTALRLLESAAAADGRLMPFQGMTDIFITPGFRFRIADMLFTNFHLPRSTLFMLVSAFAGLERMRSAYAHAIAAGYRFYSYGDACLLERGGE